MDPSKTILCPFCAGELIVDLVDFRNYAGPMMTPGSPGVARHAYVLRPEFQDTHTLVDLPVFGDQEPQVAVSRCAFKTPETVAARTGL